MTRDHLILLASLGWFAAAGASFLLVLVTRLCHRRSCDNKALRDQVFCLEQSQRFWKAVATPSKP